MSQEKQSQKVGQHYMFAVKDLYKDNRLRTDILSEEPFLYRWWFPSNSPIVKYLEEYLEAHPEDIDLHYIYVKLKRKVIGKETYFALYVGQSTNGRKRFYQHTRGVKKASTLRRTIHAILSLQGLSCSEIDISTELNECYFEWMEFCKDDQELLDGFELIAITIGHYPLNIEGNPLISKSWGSTIYLPYK